jgi:hypothetical protein
MPEYERLTHDELLHLAEEKAQLTDEARVALEAEIMRRRLSPSDLDAYKLQGVAADKADKLKRATPDLILSGGLGKKFLGKANRHRDPTGLFETI